MNTQMHSSRLYITNRESINLLSFKIQIIMKKENILKLLEIIYDETNNCITASRANNYWCTVDGMSEESFQEVKSFYIDFINEALPGLLKQNKGLIQGNNFLGLALIFQLAFLPQSLSKISLKLPTLLSIFSSHKNSHKQVENSRV